MRKTTLAIIFLLIILLLPALVWATISWNVPIQYLIYNTTTTNISFSLSNYPSTCSVYARNSSENYTSNVTDYYVVNNTGGINITNLTWRDGDRTWTYVTCNGTTGTQENSTVRVFDIDTDYAVGISLATSLTVGNYKVNLSTTGDVNGTSAYFTNYSDDGIVYDLGEAILNGTDATLVNLNVTYINLSNSIHISNRGINVTGEINATAFYGARLNISGGVQIGGALNLTGDLNGTNAYFTSYSDDGVLYDLGDAILNGTNANLVNLNVTYINLSNNVHISTRGINVSGEINSTAFYGASFYDDGTLYDLGDAILNGTNANIVYLNATYINISNNIHISNMGINVSGEINATTFYGSSFYADEINISNNVHISTGGINVSGEINATKLYGISLNISGGTQLGGMNISGPLLSASDVNISGRLNVSSRVRLWNTTITGNLTITGSNVTAADQHCCFTIDKQIYASSNPCGT